MARNAHGVEFLSRSEHDAIFESRGIKVPERFKASIVEQRSAEQRVVDEVETRAANDRWLAAAWARANEVELELRSVKGSDPRLMRSQR